MYNFKYNRQLKYKVTLETSTATYTTLNVYKSIFTIFIQNIIISVLQNNTGILTNILQNAKKH